MTMDTKQLIEKTKDELQRELNELFPGRANTVDTLVLRIDELIILRMANRSNPLESKAEAIDPVKL